MYYLNGPSLATSVTMMIIFKKIVDFGSLKKAVGKNGIESILSLFPCCVNLHLLITVIYGGSLIYVVTNIFKSHFYLKIVFPNLLKPWCPLIWRSYCFLRLQFNVQSFVKFDWRTLTPRLFNSFSLQVLSKDSFSEGPLYPFNNHLAVH